LLGLSGSRIGIIESELLSSRGPLYGRAEHVLWLDPFSPQSLVEVFPLYSPAQLVEVYAVTGGVPHYFSLFKQTHSVLTNLEKRLEESSAPFQTEPAFLLAEEFSEPTKYLAILEAIASGATKRQLVAQLVGMESSHLGPYLETLTGLRLLKRIVPVTDHGKEDSRKGLWQLADPFLAFYFRFIAPYLSWIEQGRVDRVMEVIKAQFPAFVGKTVFEGLCQSYLQEEGFASRLTFTPERVGRQWGKGYEIDVAAISDKEKVMLIGEAKWETRKTGPEVLRRLLAKKALLEKETGYFVQTALFSKAGFGEALTREAVHNHTLLISLDKLLKVRCS
jgi:AAA+ ATPase superfamily predicted ATPase